MHEKLQNCNHADRDFRRKLHRVPISVTAVRMKRSTKLPTKFCDRLPNGFTETTRDQNLHLKQTGDLENNLQSQMQPPSWISAFLTAAAAAAARREFAELIRTNTHRTHPAGFSGEVITLAEALHAGHALWAATTLPTITQAAFKRPRVGNGGIGGSFLWKQNCMHGLLHANSDAASWFYAETVCEPLVWPFIPFGVTHLVPDSAPAEHTEGGNEVTRWWFGGS